VNPDSFRAALRALLQGAAESGLDIFWLHSELSLVSMQLVDEARCDLVVCDEEEEHAP
jgi:hypothetical protein